MKILSSRKMKFASLCIFIVATVAIVEAARPSKHHPKGSGPPDFPPSPDGANPMMDDPLGGGSMQDPDAARAKDNSPMGEGYPKKNKGRGRRRPRLPSSMPTSMPTSMPSPMSTSSTTQMPSSPEFNDRPMNEPERNDEKKGSGDMMSMSTTTPMPSKMMHSTTTAKAEMNMFPDLDTVEQLQKKQAEEHEKIIAVYKSFKDWVDYLRTSIKGGTLNPVLTRRILEDIRAYQQVIMSPHPHKPYTPPHPCDPLRDVWCPEKPSSMMVPTMFKPMPRRNSYDPVSSLVLI